MSVDPLLRARRPRRMVRWAGALAITAILALVASACSSPRSSLGTTDSPCFVALPKATTAVHHRGHLRGVRSIDWGALRRTSPFDESAALPPPHPGQQLCLVAYTGSFTRASVERPVGRASAPIAVVVVSWPENQVVATALLHHPSIRFGHPGLGS